MNSPRRAFTLTELLYSLIVLSIAALISARLFSSSMRVIAYAPKAQEQRACIDRMSDVLRHDTWCATKISAPDPDSIELTNSKGLVVRWRFSTDGVTRTASDAPIDHWTPQIALRPQSGSGIVTLTSPDAPLEQLRFISQFIQAGGSR
jgi:prepilin-type N-terminal cleavage/methylation domain-containing protein